MIPLRCPHCQIGLKVDESKLPSGIETFACPKCRKSIPVSLVIQAKESPEDSSVTILLSSKFQTGKIGKLRVSENQFTPAQVIDLHEGVNIIGRKYNNQEVNTAVVTEDKLMSRTHIIIEVKKDTKNRFNHYLSDNKSKNRTLYNSSYLEQGEIVVLKTNDQIQIGQTLLVFEEQTTP